MIQLRELRLDGWLSYDRVSIRLNMPGITRIAGKMGSGKSAILEAITYLITGKTIRSKSSVKDLCNQLLDNGYDISIDLLKDKDVVQIREVRDRASKGLYFDINGDDRRGKTDIETRSNILKFLDITPDEFKSINVIGQRQAHLLVEGSPKDRAQVIVDVFNLNVYDQLVTACKQEVIVLEKKLDDVSTTIDQKNTEIVNTVEMIAEVTTRIHGLDDLTLAAKITRYTDRLAVLDDKLERLHVRQAKVRGVLTGVTKKQKAKINISNYEHKVETLVSGLVENPTSAQLCALDDVDTLKNSIAVCTHDGHTFNCALQKITTLSNICPVNKKECPVNIPIKYKATTIKTIKKDIKRVIKEKKNYQLHLSELLEIQNIVQNNTKIEGEINQLEELIKTIEKSIDNSDDNQSEDAYTKTLLNLQKKVINYKDKKTRINTKLVELNQLMGTLSSSTETLHMLQERKSRTTVQLQKLQKLYKQNKKAHELSIDALTVFKKLKLFKIDSIIEILNKETSEILQTISNETYDIVLSSQKMSADNKRALDKINIIVSDGYKQLPVEMWSGGQITEVALAIILGTWKAATMLANTAITSLWLDEVFGPIDAKTIDLVFESVVRVCELSNVSSVFVISHRDLDSRLFDQILTTKLSNGISTITSTQ